MRDSRQTRSALESRLLMLAAACVALAGCAETKIATHAIKKANRYDTERQAEAKRQEEGAPPSASTIYKIGNPYQIEGTWYRPKEEFDYSETGVASWYGDDFHGRPTANGEVFNMHVVSAAHRTLQLPSVVRITNLENGRSLVVRVNDRGPFARGRIIDLSQKGAQMLGYYGRGTAKVKVEVLASESRKMKEAALRGERLTVAQLTGTPDDPAETAAIEMVGLSPVETVREPMIEPAVAIVPAEAPSPVISEDRVIADPLAEQARQVAMIAPGGGPVPFVSTSSTSRFRQVFVQAGSFAQFDNAVRAQATIDTVAASSINAANANGQRVFRVRLGPFSNQAEANAALEQAMKRGYAGARIVTE